MTVASPREGTTALPPIKRAQSSSTTTTTTFTSIRDRVSRALSPNRNAEREDSPSGRQSFGRSMSHLGEERGRQPIVSTGRGGAGNLFSSPNRGQDPEVLAHPGVERGREVLPRETSGDRITHSGRGGAGNIRSPSRDPARDRQYNLQEDALQARLVAEERGRQAHGNFSTGRGGAGNISRSKSRSRSAVRDDHRERESHRTAPHLVSGGRGGFGNIQEAKERPSGETDPEDKYEASVLAHHQAEEAGKPHITGRGGAGGYSTAPLATMDFDKLTLEEQEAYRKVHARDNAHGYSTGKGGAGNIFHKSHSPAGEERGRGAEKGEHKGGVFGSVMRSLSRATGRD